jgi:transposase-like protein
MGTKDKERRVYPKEFKAEAAALAGKHEKPVRQTAADLEVNENMLYRWIQQSREAGGSSLPAALPRTRTAAGPGACPPAERKQDSAGGGVKPCFI